MLGDGPREIADQSLGAIGVFGYVDCGHLIGMRDAGQRHLGHKLVTEGRELFEREPVIREIIDVEIMVGIVEVTQAEIGRVAPTIGLAREKGDAFAGCGRLDE